MLSEPARPAFKLSSRLCFAFGLAMPPGCTLSLSCILVLPRMSLRLLSQKQGLVAQQSSRSSYSQITNAWIVSFHSRHEQDVLIQCLGMLSCPCRQLEYSLTAFKSSHLKTSRKEKIYVSYNHQSPCLAGDLFVKLAPTSIKRNGTLLCKVHPSREMSREFRFLADHTELYRIL